MQPMQQQQQPMQQQQQQQQGGEVAATSAVCSPTNGAPPVARTLFHRDEADRVATDEEKRVDEVAKLVKEKVDAPGNAHTLGRVQRLALASYPTDDEGRLQLAAGCVAVAKALLNAARPKNADGQQPKRLALAWTEHARRLKPEHEGALWWQHVALEELNYLAAAHARLEQLCDMGPSGAYYDQAYKKLKPGVSEEYRETNSLPVRLKNMQQNKVVKSEFLGGKCKGEELNDNSPCKVLYRISPASVAHLEKKENTPIKDAATLLPGDKVEKYNKAFVKECPTFPNDIAPLSEEWWQARLDRATHTDAVIGGWNAMASLQTHGLTAEILQRKARNIARVIIAKNVAVMAVSECPGAALSCKTEEEEKAKWAADQTFMDMILQQLNQVSRFEGRRIPVACMKRTVVKQPDQGEDPDGGDGGDDGATHLDGVADDDITTETIQTKNCDMGESHYFLWDCTRFQLDGNIQPCSIPGGQWHRAPAMVVLRQVSSTPVPGRLVILSVHLKSGGKKPTKGAVKQIHSHAIPYIKDLLEKDKDNDDTIIIIGDFNLNPGDEAFNDLKKKDGFRYVGESDVATNQQEWLLAEEEKASEVYDSVWVWHRQGSAAGRSWVWKDTDLGNALEDRNLLMEKLSAVVEDLTEQQFCSEVGRELWKSGGLTPAVKNAVKTHFKSKVNKDWSDHKPIGISLPLPSVEQCQPPEHSSKAVTPPPDGTALAGEDEGITVDMAEVERLRAFKANVERALGIEEGSSEADTLAAISALQGTSQEGTSE
jgi:hypothetical protein